MSNILNIKMLDILCGERGIRTPGTSQCDGFQDRCNRPLYHLSSARLFQKRVQRYKKDGKCKTQNVKNKRLLTLFNKKKQKSSIYIHQSSIKSSTFAP